MDDEPQDKQKQPHGSAGLTPEQTRSEASNFIVQLFDLQMRQMVTTRMLPLIYGSGIALAALLSLYSILWAFEQAWWQGIAWLVIVGPALFFAVLITIRVLLEFVLTVFRIFVFLEALGSQIEGIADQTEDIAQDLPRIMFWRGLRRQKD